MSRLLPNWIEAYLVYTAESRSPDEFHLWSGLSAIAGAVRRKAWFPFDYFLLYPNLYVVLVSPAGLCKKSTAMRIARKILSQVPGLSFSVDSTSRERMIVDIGSSHTDGHSSVTVYSSEFASFVTTSGIDMVVMLTDLYDSPDIWEHRTKGGGSNKLKGPYLNLIAGTTPEWIARSLPLDTIGIGLTSRIIFVYSDKPRVRKPFPELSKEQLELGDLLVKDLATISEISGQYTMTDEAKEWYVAWDVENQKRRNLDDPRLAGYFARKDMHLIKASMLIAASQRNETSITQSDLEKALGLLEQLEPAMAKTFAAVGRNPLNVETTNAGIAVALEPGITYAKLLNMFRHSLRRDELDEVLGVLTSVGQVKSVQETDGPHFYPLKLPDNDKQLPQSDRDGSSP